MLKIAILIVVVFIGLIVYSGFKSSKKEAEKIKENKVVSKGDITTGSSSALRFSGDVKNAKSTVVETGPKLSAENEKIIKTLRQYLIDEKMIMGRIKNADVSGALAPILDKAETIVAELRKQPEEIQNAKQFVNYYIPTLDVILKKFEKLENSEVDITTDTEKVLSYLSDIQKALNNQYDSLFSDEKLDLSVEMEAMTLAFKRDGLIDESEYKDIEEVSKIELTI